MQKNTFCISFLNTKLLHYHMLPRLPFTIILVRSVPGSSGGVAGLLALSSASRKASASLTASESREAY